MSIKAVEPAELFILHLKFSVRNAIFALQSFQLLNTMEFEYGKIEAMEESEKPFITLTIRQNIAYEAKLRKFNVFNVKYIKKQLGEALQKGTNVKFTTIKNDKFYNLKTIEECGFSECFGCGAYTPERNKQQMECEKCYGSQKKLKLDKELKVVKRSIAKYTYSLGITVTFIDEKEECLINHLYVSTTFENNANFKKLHELKVGDKKQICGWVREENDHCSFVEIMSIIDIQESN
mgnify:CR=1 FL=1